MEIGNYRGYPVVDMDELEDGGKMKEFIFTLADRQGWDKIPEVIEVWNCGEGLFEIDLKEELNKFSYEELKKNIEERE